MHPKWTRNPSYEDGDLTSTEPQHHTAPLSHTAFPISMANPQQQRQPPAKASSANIVMNAIRGKGNSPAATAAKKPPRKKPSQRQARPLVMVLPDHFGSIHSPNENDVLSGRGGRINSHKGNVRYREMVNATKERYLDERTKKLEKAHIAAEIVYAIRSLNPPGRFLTEQKDGTWTEIGDTRAFKKVGQALREDAPELRDSEQVVTTHSSSTTPSPQKKPAASKTTAASPPETIAAVTRTVSKRGGRMGSMPMEQEQAAQAPNYIPTAPSPVFSEPPIVPSHHSEFQKPEESFGRRNISQAVAQTLNDNNCFEAPVVVPPAMAYPRAHDELFGRMFYPPPANDRESSLLSNVSCPSVMSGVSQISGVTDPFSALSESKQQQMMMTTMMSAPSPAPLVSHNDDMSWNPQTKGTPSVTSLSMAGDEMSQLSEQFNELYKDLEGSSQSEKRLWEV